MQNSSEHYMHSMKANKWLFFALIILLEAIIYRDFIFGESVFLFKDLGDDSLISMYPAWQQRIDIFANGQIPGWSFQTAMGENIYPYCFEPVTLFILLVFFKNDIVFGFIWVQLIHTFLSGSIFYFFLRNLKLHQISSIFGGLLYAFSGYMLVAGSWMTTVFSTECTQLAFVLFALNQFLSKNRKYFYPLSVAYASFVTPFNLYFVAIISLVYFGLNFYIKSKQNNTTLIQSWLKLVFHGFIGIGISSFILLSNLAAIFNSPRGSNTYNFSKNANFFDLIEFKTVILRVFSSNSLGNPDDFVGWKNYFEAPILNTSLSILILVPLLFNFVSSKAKRAISVVLFTLIALFAMPILRHSLWLFNGDYYRSLSLFSITVGITLASYTLHYLLTKYSTFKSKSVLVFSGLASIVVIFTSLSQKAVASPGITVIVLFLILYGAVLFFWSKSVKYPYMLIGLVCFELIIFTSPPITDRKKTEKSDFEGRKNKTYQTKKAVEYIRQVDPSFYRTEKDYFSGETRDKSYNDAKLEHYFGTKSYNSFHNKNYISFLDNIGVLNIENEYSTRWLDGLTYSPEAMQLCNVKYFISTNSDTTDHIVKKMKAVHEINGLTIFKNPNFIPFGTSFSKTISEEEFLKIDRNQRVNFLLDGVPIKNKKLINSKSPKVLGPNMIITSFRSDKIEGKIDLKTKMFLFFALPFDRGWTLLDNGKKVTIESAYFGLSGAYLESGKHNLELVFKDSYLNTGLIISIISIILYLTLFLINSKLKNQ